MAYIIIGLVSVIFLLGGGKRFALNFGGRRIVIVIMLTLAMVGNIIPPLKISNSFYILLGGSLLLIYALISAFYKNRFITILYIFYISALLGFGFYFFGKYVLGDINIGLFGKADWLFYSIIALAICLFAGDPKNAFSIGILSITVADLLYVLQHKMAMYTLGASEVFTAMVVVTSMAVVAQILIKMVTVRVCPNRKEMLFEASDELYPDEKDNK